MGSSLSGLRKALAWSDFRRKRMPPPEAGESGTAAQTSTVFSAPALQSKVIDGSKPVTYRLADTINIAIRLKRDECWVATWVFDLSLIHI